MCPLSHTCSISSSAGLCLISFSFFSCFPPFYIYISTRAFASFNRGQPPAQQNKVVDSHLCPLKSGGTCLCVPVCANDTMSLKPASVGRGTVDVHVYVSAQTNNNATCDVCVCGSVRCKTCKHISQGSSFM